MKKNLIIIIAVILLAALGVVGFIYLSPAQVSREEATQIALDHIGANFANRAERGFEDFNRVWSVEVPHAGAIHEVHVHIQTGEIVRIDIY